MATKSHNSVPFSHLSRLGFGLGLRSSNPAWAQGNEKYGSEDEWYIPYRGPYEPPPAFQRRKERDSWGDLIHGEEDEDDTALTSFELHKRYGMSPNAYSGDGKHNGVDREASLDSDRNGLGDKQRGRTQSGVSGRTVSSGTVDPGRGSMTNQRRSTVSSSRRPSIPSYANLDAVGGVGESPVPITHRRSSSKETNRTSFASLFSLGSQGRNKQPSERMNILLPRKLSRSGQPAMGTGINHGAKSHRRSISSGSNSALVPRNAPRPDDKHSIEEAEDDKDFYTSYYYSTVIPSTPSRNTITAQPLPPTGSPSNTRPKAEKNPPIQPSRHPYAYVSSTSLISDGPRTAPLPTPHGSSTDRNGPHASGPTYLDPPQPTLNEALPPPPPKKPASADVTQTQFPLPLVAPLSKGLERLKSSTSTPDLRSQARSNTSSPSYRNKRLPARPPPSFKGKDRWLSAETWCDALLFPRPRLKIKHEDGEKGHMSSGRIVSPPESPIQQGLTKAEDGKTERGVASRVLAHSRSLVDLHRTEVTPPTRSVMNEENPSLGAAVQHVPQAGLSTPQDGLISSISNERPPRPKSFALDDLALPSPIPSLARVLAEGELLTNQRKEWQMQATQSFQNRRTRSMSRARSKSVTQKGTNNPDPPPSHIEFLAARACLGNQPFTPVITSQEREHPFPRGGPFNKSSQSNSGTPTKPPSKSPKSSKSYSRGHSRTGSWSRSALKVAKSAACGLTSTDANYYDSTTSSAENWPPSGTRFIRLADPAQIPLDKGHSVETTPNSNSPTPSGLGIGTDDARIGIALTTPPLEDIMRFPAHPYAQAALYNYSNYVPGPVLPQKGKRTLAEQTTLNNNQQGTNDNIQDRPTVSHPYAQRSSSQDSYLLEEKVAYHPRADSDVPPPAKMWAQWSPGIFREILPGDIQYSPFMSESSDDTSTRNSTTINDTVGVGEALAYAVRPKRSKDSGLGTSEDHAVLDPNPPQVVGKRSYRQPVQYDATRPPYQPQGQKHSHPSSAHTLASSPLVRSSTPPPDLPRTESPRSVEFLHSRTSTTSPESASPPLSPRLIGNPDDLDNFHDLFYRPKRLTQGQLSEHNSSVPSTSLPPEAWNWRTGSSLTGLAHRLSQEFEREAIQHSGSSATDSRGSMVRRPTNSTLEFVFEEASQPGSSPSIGSMSPPGQSIIPAFQPSSAQIPEDVESSRSSSLLEPEEDRTELFRVGSIESVSTPPPVEENRRTSHIGQMFEGKEHQLNNAQGRGGNVAPSSPRPRTNSGLQPPSADPTRSSYMTTSTASRMSRLSDFPAPPPGHNVGHISLLSSYFDEALSQSEARASQSPDSIPPKSIPTDDASAQTQRLTFGGDEDVEDLVAALSSHSSHSSHHP